MTRPRSLLVVLTDQQRADVAGYAGGEAATPHLDGLAAAGAVSTGCHATTPVCCPSRATLLTGTESLEHGVVGNDLALRPDAVTMGETASAAGYRTAYIGKWHLDGVPRDRFTPPGPRRHGFGFWRAYNCTHDYLHPRYFADTDEVIEPGGYEPVVQTDLLLEFLDDLGTDDPFLGVLAWGPPHDPYDQLPDADRARYDPASLSPPSDPDGPGEFVPPDAELRRIVADYYGAVSALDDQLGRILAALDRLGRTEDTVVVFTSDHGDMLGAHGYLKKQLPYRESVQVPFVVRAPGVVPAGHVTDALLPTVDLAPTLLALAGVPVPPTMTGLDRSAELRGAMPPARDEIVLANYTVFDEGRRQGIPEWRGLRTTTHTYAEAVGGRPWLLFDDAADPAQRHNLVDELPELVREHSARLATHLAAAGDPFHGTSGTAELVGRGDEWAERETYTF